LFTLLSVEIFVLERSVDNQCGGCCSVQIGLFHFKKLRNIGSKIKKWSKIRDFLKNDLANYEATIMFCSQSENSQEFVFIFEIQD